MLLKRVKNLSIVIPSNIFSDIPNLREKTVRVANLVRTLIIFRINNLIIFEYIKRDKKLIKLLRFFNTPSYLRKYLFPIDKDLRYIGVAPPIRPLFEDSNEFKLGLVLKNYENFSLVELGLQSPVKIENEKLKEKQIVKLIKRNNKWLIDKESKFYYNFEIYEEKDLIKLLTEYKKKKSLIIATSKELGLKGKVIDLNLLNEIKEVSRNFSNIIVLFGSPKEGLYEIFQNFSSNLDEIADYIINIFPNQGTVTVRTDEAIFGFLSIFNLIFE